MAQQIIIDTHTHTKASDGTFTPTESVKHAKSVGLEVLAKTDHDTTWGNDEAVNAGEQYGVHVIPGIEIDAVYKDPNSSAQVSDIELLGLNIDTKRMQPFVEQLGQTRLQSVEEYVGLFNAYIQSPNFQIENASKNIQLQQVKPFSVKDLVGWYNDKMNFDNPFPFLSKISFLEFVLDKYAIPNEQVQKAQNGDRAAMGAFKKEYAFLLTKSADKTSFYEAIDAVKHAGGTPVIAHPGLSKGYVDGMIKEWELPKSEWFTPKDALTPFAFISDLVNHGLEGIEQYYYAGSDKKHAQAQDQINAYFGAMADTLGLLKTYGSDCHGHKGKGPLKGQFGGTQNYSHLL